MHVVPPPKTFIELSVKDGNGVEIERYTDRAHSWVRNEYNGLAYLYNFGAGSGSGFVGGSLQMKSATEVLHNSNLTHSLGAIGGTNDGIIVGTGVGAESFESTTLTRISSGTSAGQLSYQAGVRGTPIYDSGTKKWTFSISRIFNNNSGAEITVREVGIAQGYSSTYDLLCRDVLTTAVPIPNAGQLTVTYTIEMTFPA